MPFHVLVTNSDIPKKALDLLVDNDCVIDQWSRPGIMPKSEILKRVSEVDAIFCTLNDKITDDIVNSCSRVKVISTMSVGADHLNKPAIQSKKIRIGYTPEVLTDTTAELIVCLTLTTLRRTLEGSIAALNGKWPDSWNPQWMCGRSVKNATIGFVGFGRINQAVASRLIGFQPTAILYTCPSKKSEEVETKFNASWCESLDLLLSKSDVVIVCCSLTASTTKLMSFKQFEQMKKGAYFINASRGAVVDQEALLEYLKNGHLAGAGLDVTTPEPLPATHPLFAQPNCVIFPHMGSACIETRLDMAMLTSKNIIAALHGKEMPAEWH